MATHQEGFFIKRLELSEKYQFESNRIFTMCRAIEGYTRCRIDIQIMHTGVRFEVIGSWSGVKKALENIQQNFCRATITGDKHAKAHSSRKVLRSMKKEDQNKILEGGVDPGQPLLTEAVLRQHNLLHEVYELREFACLRCRQYWWRKVLTTKRVSMCKGCGVKYDALRRDKEFGIGRYMCQNKNCNRTFYRFCHATLACKCKECYEMVHHPHVHPRFRKTLKIRKPLDPDTTLYDPYEGEAVQKKSGGEGFEPYERKKKRKYIFNPSTRHQSTGSTEMTFLTQAIRSDIGDDNNSEIISIASSTDSFSSSDNGSDSDSTPNQSDDDSQIESSVSTIPPSDSDNDSECDTSSSHPNQKRELGTYSSDDSSENDDNDDKTPSETESADSGKFSSLASTIQDSGIGTASNIDTVSTADSANNTADSANTTAATVHTTSHGWKRSSTIKPDYLPVKFSRREFRENVDHHGADIIGEGIHVIIPPDAIHQGNISVTVQACLGGPFEIPSDYEPISPVYLLHPPYVFQTEVELKIKVFADRGER